MSTSTFRPARHVPAFALLAVAVTLATASLQAEPCALAMVAVNKPGFRAGATVPWTTAAAPDGTPFPPALRDCVAAAFDAWTTANARSGSGVRFVPGDGGIMVRLDNASRLVLPGGHAGAWTEVARGRDGALESAIVWLTADATILRRCEGATKAVLHELGHLHGLADTDRHRGPSVMNDFGGRDDERGHIPLAPTLCDAAQAARATARRGPAPPAAAYGPPPRRHGPPRADGAPGGGRGPAE
jgi:hypothetical protein